LRIRWLFGDQIAWELRMIGIAESRKANTDKGLDPAFIAEQAEGLVARYGMPLFTGLREAVPATIPACRAVVAVRMHVPELEWAFLRRLRVRAMGGAMLDDPDVVDDAAGDVEIDAGDLHDWTAEPDVAAQLAEDLRQARSPTPAALALRFKLGSTTDGGVRYSPPSYVLADSERSYTVPGMQSVLAYETALANLAPHLDRRPEPGNVAEVLRWAGYPLATQEVAEVCSTSRDEARERLVAANATEMPVASDSYWHL
jgi:predicted DsbA family dithiol-disulfide isomerase